MTSMSENELCVRLGGDLPPDSDLTTMLGVAPTVSHRRGELLRGGTGRRRKSPDVWIVDLIDREQWHGPDADGMALERAIATLRTMAPGLAALDRSRCSTELYLSSIREECQGTVDLPAALVAAAAAGGLELGVSVASIPQCAAADIAAADDESGETDRNRLSLRVRGESSCLDPLVAALTEGPGGPSPFLTTARTADSLTAPGEWDLQLIGFQDWQGIVPLGPGAWRERAPDNDVMGRAVAMLESLAPMLAGLSRHHCYAALWLRSIRESDDGGYYLHASVIAAAAAGRLDVVLSIRCPPEDDVDHDGDDDDEGNGDLDSPTRPHTP